MMDKDIYNWKSLNPFFKKGGAIPVSAKASKDAFGEAHKRLLNGKIVSLYPEGGISKNGEIGKFYKGYEMIPANYDGIIIPFYIDGIFGSRFSKHKPKSKKRFYKRREIKVYFDAPISKDIKAEQLKEKILQMKEKYETK